MKAFRTLLKIASNELETLRRALASMLARQAALQQRMAAHEQAIAREQALAARDFEAARLYGGYAAAALKARKTLEAEQGVIEAEIARLRTLIGEAHVEVRKFERLLELEAQRAKARREKREDAELDEMATMRAGRSE